MHWVSSFSTCPRANGGTRFESRRFVACSSPVVVATALRDTDGRGSTFCVARSFVVGRRAPLSERPLPEQHAARNLRYLPRARRGGGPRAKLVLRRVILGNNKNAYAVAHPRSPSPRQLTHPSLEQYSRIEGGAYIDWRLRDHLASRVESFRGVIRGLEKRRERGRVVDQQKRVEGRDSLECERRWWPR